MLKVGIIGLGVMGAKHARVYKELGCEIVGVVDADADRAKKISSEYNAPYYTDYHNLLGKAEAVSIAVPTNFHHEIALSFINSKTHCLIEKPIASTLSEARDIVHATYNNDVKVLIGHIERFNPVVLKLKQLIDSGRLGTLIQISIRRVGPFQARIRDVGVIVDAATHDIDITRFLIGKEPANIHTKSGSLRHNKNDHALVMLDYGTTFASIEVNWLTPHKVRTMVVTGSKGIAYLDYINQKLSIYNSSVQDQIEVQQQEPLINEIRHFVSCVTDDRPPLVDSQEGLNTIIVALKAQEAC